ncbi:MAG: hypothetical protein DBX55_07495 [Verrucomicrobia bacterium]|nr:MAG: hypothetical protein DBX55_07495 [Verrucomicrobiota bacterium]
MENPAGARRAFSSAGMGMPLLPAFERWDWKREIARNNGESREFKGFGAESSDGFEFGNFLRRHPPK